MGEHPVRDWRAAWIDDGRELRDEDVLLWFRREFTPRDREAWRAVRVSADSVYRLWLNGESVGRGPERWSVEHRVFDEHDLSERVRPDEPNVLAVEVLRWGSTGPTFDISARPALLVEGPELVSDEEFRVHRCEGFNRHGPPAFPRVVHVAGNWLEHLDASDEPSGWRESGFDDSDWRPARELVPAADEAAPWRLFPRSLPPMEEYAAEELLPVQFGYVAGSLPAPPFGFATHRVELPPGPPFEVPANGHVAYFAFDARRVVTAFLEIEFEAAAGTAVEVMYAESPRLNFQKGHRDDLDGQRVEGYTDVYVCRGGRQTFEPHTYRTFRYLRIAVRAAGPTRLLGVRFRWTGFPLEQRGEFACSDPLLDRIWQVGWETCRLCAHETYEDSPHYEQLQYVGDMRIQALVSYVVGGEWRLAAKALRQLAEGRTETSFLPSRYPSRELQVIPGYSLLWIEMLEEFQLYSGQDAIARELLPLAQELLATFREHEDPLGCLRELPMWNFLDWTYPSKGVPHQAGDVCTPMTMFYVGALAAAARLERRLGEERQAAEYEARAARTAAILRKQTYSVAEGLFRDGVVRRDFSRHANALAILYGIVEGEPANALAERLHTDPRLRPTSFYFDFYVHRALDRIGRTDLLFRDLARWREMLDLGATAWFELANGDRSDCHGWSASPTFDLATTVLGVRVTEPGGRAVRIEPHTGGLEWARGKVATPLGEIAVAWEDRDEFRLDVELPPGVTATLVHPDGRVQTVPGRN